MNDDALEYAKLNEDRTRESIQTLLDSDDGFSLMREWGNNYSDIKELKKIVNNNKMAILWIH